MNLLKLSFTRVMVVFAAIAVAISCDRGGDEANSLPNLQLMVEVEDITTTTAKIKVSHELEAQNTWYGFVTDDTVTDAATLLNESVAKGVEAEELHRSKQYITILEELTPETSYRYIATGLTAEGVQYGEITIVEFKTLKQTSVQEEEYNGMRRNDAWTVMYVGKDRLNDVEYDHVVRVISTDNNPYAITLVYADAYDPYQLKDLADAMLVDLKNYLVEYNERNATSFTFADMLYTGNGADPFDPDPGVYRALAVGFTPEGLEGFAAFKADDALFLDGTLGVSNRSFNSAGAALFTFFNSVKLLQFGRKRSNHIGHFVFGHDANRSLRLNELDRMLKIIFHGRPPRFK